MKRVLIIICLLGGMVISYAQTSLTMPHRDVLTVEYGGQWMLDGYLSPLIYDGQFIGVSNEWWTRFKGRKHEESGSIGVPSENKPEIAHWSHVGNLQIKGAKVISERKNNRVYTLDAQGGWGAVRSWQWDLEGSKGIEWQQFKVEVGPYLGADVMAKELSSHVNKPYSMDIAIDGCIMANLQYAFRCRKTAYAIGYSARMNMAGMEWLPDYWTSYYEVSEGVRLKESIAFSHIVNRQHIQQQLYMDFQLLHSSWRVGVKHEYLNYGSSVMPFRRSNVSGYIGAIFNYQTTPTRIISPF